MSVDLACVNPANVHEIWPQARELIRAAIEKTGLSDFAEVEASVLSGDQLLWLAISDRVEAAATTHLSNNVCTLVACSGHDMERWLPFLSRIEHYAKAEGCKCVRVYGRKGWERVLKNYRVEHVILERHL